MPITKQAAKFKAKVRAGFEFLAKDLDKLTGGRLSPNMVSWLGALLHLPVAWLIINCYLGYGGILLLLVAPLDLLDGALARVQHKVSAFGAVLDACLDRLKEIIVLAAVGYHLAASGDQLAVGLCLLALGFSLLVSYVKAKSEMAVAGLQPKETLAQLNRRFEFGFMGYEIRVLILGISLIADQLVIGLGLITVGAALTAAIRLFKFRQAGR